MNYGGRAKALLELVRLPNLFTAMADPAMGALVVGADRLPSGHVMLEMVVAAATMFYAGGVVLNDVYDADRDALERPSRPVPSGRLTLGAARRIGWTFLAFGTAAAGGAAWLAGSVGPLLFAIALLACIVGYDMKLKATVLGPPTMGACRALSVLFGASTQVVWHGSAPTLIAMALGVYVMGITLFARTEAETSRRVDLGIAAAVMLAGMSLLCFLPWMTDELIEVLCVQPWRWLLVVAILAAAIGGRLGRAIVVPSPARVQAAVVASIWSIVVLDAACCFAVRGALPAVAIVMLLLPAIHFSRMFRPT